ncbi:MAG: hypothetical protein M1831_007305 [Alyxoria varia]|nr:MAG: hypothetical protein M1831_007305 [Alyxoria varia]
MASGQAPALPSNEIPFKSACTGCKRSFKSMNESAAPTNSQRPLGVRLVLHYHGPRDDETPPPPRKRRRLVLHITKPAPPMPTTGVAPAPVSPVAPPQLTTSASSQPTKSSPPAKKRKNKYPCAGGAPRKKKGQEKTRTNGSAKVDEYGIPYLRVVRPKPGQKLAYPRREGVLPWKREGVHLWADGSWDHKDAYRKRMESYWGRVIPWMSK